MVVKGRFGLWGFTVFKAVVGVEALFFRGGGGGLFSFLGSVTFLFAFSSVVCGFFC